MTFVEPGPVSLIEPPLGAELVLLPPPELLVMPTLVSLLEPLLALPVVALPPEVLPETVALPVLADCELMLVTPTLLSLRMLVELDEPVDMTLVECGPVSEMLSGPELEPLLPEPL